MVYCAVLAVADNSQSCKGVSTLRGIVRQVLRNLLAGIGPSLRSQPNNEDSPQPIIRGNGNYYTSHPSSQNISAAVTDT